MTKVDKLTIEELSGSGLAENIDQLSDVLIDCVDGGASVSFMYPMTREKAKRFWQGVAAGVNNRDRALLDQALP